MTSSWSFTVTSLALGQSATWLQWRHLDHDSVSNHQPHDCLLNRLFRRRSKKTSKLRVTGLCVGNSPGPVNSPHKGPVTRKMFPFDDVIMLQLYVDADYYRKSTSRSECSLTITLFPQTPRTCVSTNLLLAVVVRHRYFWFLVYLYTAPCAR